MRQDARYTSPSGKEASFAWEAVSRKTDLKTGVYTFPGRDGAHVQHQGAGARSFPMVCIFYGSKHLEQADAFEAMLTERGTGELQHPVYGTIKAIPTEEIAREDDPINRNGESLVTVTFTETIVFEDAANLATAASDRISKRLDQFSEASAADFASAIAAADKGARSGILSNLARQTQSIAGALQDVAMGGKEAFAEWMGVVSELTGGIAGIFQGAADIADIAFDVYAGALTIARQTLFLMKLPATLAVNISEKIRGYSALTAELINQYKNDPFDIEKMKAAYASAKLAIEGAVASIASGAALSVTGGKVDETVSRGDLIDLCDQILSLLADAARFNDEKIESLNDQDGEPFIDAAAETHLALEELVYAGVDSILTALSALPLQRTMTLDRDRQVVELCVELYGTENRLDEFIARNNFNIDEIGLIPMGREVVYYAEVS